ncbi:MAG TPA: hypothetical protein DCY13_17580 [Verrucomicrobiales bacterium]|nr:hypothetical protein [Verrucomicrobiales bacterium]
MRRTLFAGLLILIFAGVGRAQLRVELLLEQKQYLINESLHIGVRLVNHTGQTLNITGTNWLSFTVEDTEGYFVRRVRDTPAPEPFEVESTYMATQWIDIHRAFAFRENASYSLRARVRIEQWNEDIYSNPVKFEIIRGTKLWEQRFGLPGSGQPNQPEIRKYILQQANYLDELQLYVRVTDESENYVFKVQRLAPMVQVSRPEAQIDTLMQLHVLTQVGRSQFLHLVVDPDANMILRNTYEGTSRQRPQLRVSPSGSVFVAGGVRQLRRDDLPPSPIFTRPLPEPPPSEEGAKDADDAGSNDTPELTVPPDASTPDGR